MSGLVPKRIPARFLTVCTLCKGTGEGWVLPGVETKECIMCKGRKKIVADVFKAAEALTPFKRGALVKFKGPGPASMWGGPNPDPNTYVVESARLHGPNSGDVALDCGHEALWNMAALELVEEAPSTDEVEHASAVLARVNGKPLRLKSP